MIVKLATVAGFLPGQKVRFLGKKARVADKDEWVWGKIPETWELWAVPVEVKDSGNICIAHVDHLSGGWQ